MYKLDITDDFSGKLFYKLTKQASELPGYIKTAEVQHSFDDLKKHAFADEHNKKFPINTKENTYVSNMYFQEAKEGISKKFGEKYAQIIENKIIKSAELFDIKEDINKFNRDITWHKTASYPVEYMLTTDFEGHTVELFPVKTATDLSNAAEAFAKDYKKLPIEWRFKVAQNMVKKAQTIGLEELPDNVCKYAGYGYYPDVNHIKNELTRRASRLKPENKEKFEKLAEHLDEINGIDDVIKLAQIVYYTEKTEGLYDKPKIAHLVSDPVISFLNTPVEKVAQALNTVSIGGSTYHLDDLKNISPEQYDETLGFTPDFENEEEAVSQLKTVPRADIKLLEEIAGLKPYL